MSLLGFELLVVILELEEKGILLVILSHHVVQLSFLIHILNILRLDITNQFLSLSLQGHHLRLLHVQLLQLSLVIEFVQIGSLHLHNLLLQLL